MGFVIWYRVALATPPLLPGAPPIPFLRISNDVFGGTFTLDADIEVAMYEGDLASDFRVRIADLPRAVADRVKADAASGLRARRPLTASIYLGYFEDLPLIRPQTAVMTGAITGVKTSVAGDRLVTELRGQELAAWQLLAYERATYCGSGRVIPERVVNAVLARARVGQVGRVPWAHSRGDYTLSATTGLSALGEVARWAQARFAVIDGGVQWQPEGPLGLPGPPLTQGKNIVSLDDELAGERPRRRRDQPENDTPRPDVLRSYELTVLGIAALRPGQTVPVTAGGPPRLLHVERATHRFSTTSGYTCELSLVEDGDGPPTGLAPRGAPRIVQRMRELASRDQRTAIDVGEVAAYEPGSNGKHLVNLDYGQRPGDDVVAPSVEAPVTRELQLSNRPLSSPFAWHKVGLIVPAYPGQRALLAHNRGDANDAVVAGYLWSEDPPMERPRNEPGDWWLCLPTSVENGRPSGRGVNDLTDASGLRAIQARGLSIAVGDGRLPAVGVRPTVPKADTLTIEHAAGTVVTVRSDGAVEIRTDGRAIALTNGSASLRLDGSRAELTNGSVTVTLNGPSVEVS